MYLINKIHRKSRPVFDQRGISSLAEITLVTGMLAILFTIGILSLTRSQNTTSISSTVDTFVSDFKEQQIKAMVGDTEGGTGIYDYGIHFDTAKYTLFRGTWSPTDPNNFVVNLPPTIEATNFFPNNEVIFLKGSGEVAGCCTGASFAVTFNDASVSLQKTLTVNRMGATSVN